MMNPFAKPYLFEKVAIIGVGLIGGSVGLAIKKHNLARKVVGLSHRQASLVKGQKSGAIDEGYTDIPTVIKGADLIVLATPVEAIVKLMEEINPYIKKNAIITDVGGTKSEIIRAAQNILVNPTYFVGSHPLAGSEKKGVEHASADLFQNALCIMTPLATTNQAAKDKIKTLWVKVGCRIKYMAPEEHDEILAYVSHMPHVVSFCMMESIPEQFLNYGARGLKDTTRIAASDPELWKDVCLSNSRYVIRSIDSIAKALAQIRKAVVERDDKALQEHFAKAKTKRESFAGTIE